MQSIALVALLLLIPGSSLASPPELTVTGEAIWWALNAVSEEPLYWIVWRSPDSTVDQAGGVAGLFVTSEPGSFEFDVSWDELAHPIGWEGVGFDFDLELSFTLESSQMLALTYVVAGALEMQDVSFQVTGGPEPVTGTLGSEGTVFGAALAPGSYVLTLNADVSWESFNFPEPVPSYSAVVRAVLRSGVATDDTSWGNLKGAFR